MVYSRHNGDTECCYTVTRYPRRFNVSAVKDATRRRICRLTALDYCCMNFVLPPVCRDEDFAGVFCNVTRRSIPGQVESHPSIEPFVYLPPGHPELHRPA